MKPLPLPPSAPPASPYVVSLAAGTELHRVHRGYPVHAFNPTPAADPNRGGRFDTVTGDPAYLYAAENESGAIAETIARYLPVSGSPQLVPWSRVVGAAIGTVKTTRALEILVLHGREGLSRVGAPLELTKCGPAEYVTTRRWVLAFLGWWPNLAGFVYRGRNDEDQLAYVFYAGAGASSRAHRAIEASGQAQPLDSGQGLLLVKRTLRSYNAELSSGSAFSASG